MRIRFMELPMEHEGDRACTPFVIVLDRVPERIAEHVDRNKIKTQTGARGVLVFEEEIQIGDD